MNEDKIKYVEDIDGVLIVAEYHGEEVVPTVLIDSLGRRYRKEFAPKELQGIDYGYYSCGIETFYIGSDGLMGDEYIRFGKGDQGNIWEETVKNIERYENA